MALKKCRKKKASTVEDHDEKMANEPDPGYCSGYEEGGAGDAKEACFQTNIAENSLYDGTSTPDKHSGPILMKRVHIDKNNHLLTATQFSIKNGLLHLNNKRFHRTGHTDKETGYWNCKNQNKCNARVVTTTCDDKTAEFKKECCRFQHSPECILFEKNLQEKLKTQKEKESQSLLLNNLSPEAPGSLEGFPACINQRNSHGSHSTNTLISIAGKQFKQVVVGSDHIALLKNISDFNEVKPPIASPEKSLTGGSNNNSSSNIFNALMLFFIIVIIIFLEFGHGIIQLFFFHLLTRSRLIMGNSSTKKKKDHGVNKNPFLHPTIDSLMMQPQQSGVSSASTTTSSSQSLHPAPSTTTAAPLNIPSTAAPSAIQSLHPTPSIATTTTAAPSTIPSTAAPSATQSLHPTPSIATTTTAAPSTVPSTTTTYYAASGSKQICFNITQS